MCGLHGCLTGFNGQPVLKAAGVLEGMWRRIGAVRRGVREDLMEQDYPTIFGEGASWSSDHG